jgi:hypothetical protein
MALYSTFFLCEPERLAKGFPDWLPPLPKPVRRKVKNPFTGQPMTIETTAPEWPRDSGAENTATEFSIVAGKGRYEDYLEDRLPAFVRRQPHWCSKGIMNLELDELGETFELKPAVEDALFSPPSWGGAQVWHVRPELLTALLALGDEELEARARRWAEAMSTPNHTHTVSGDKISDGWKPSDALRILQPLITLARKAAQGQALYLIIEL